MGSVVYLRKRTPRQMDSDWLNGAHVTVTKTNKRDCGRASSSSSPSRGKLMNGLQRVTLIIVMTGWRVWVSRQWRAVTHNRYFSAGATRWKYWYITKIRKKLTSWFLEPGGSMPHSQRFSHNPYPEPNQLISSYWYLFL